jgi:hypothetical protein
MEACVSVAIQDIVESEGAGLGGGGMNTEHQRDQLNVSQQGLAFHVAKDKKKVADLKHQQQWGIRQTIILTNPYRNLRPKIV